MKFRSRPKLNPEKGKRIMTFFTVFDKIMVDFAVLGKICHDFSVFSPIIYRALSSSLVLWKLEWRGTHHDFGDWYESHEHGTTQKQTRSMEGFRTVSMDTRKF